MHVAFWSPGWPLVRHHNGIVTYVDAMKRELEKRGHTVSVFTTELAGDGAAPRIYAVHSGVGARLRRHLPWRRATPSHGLFGFAATIAAAMRRVHRHEPIDIIEMEETFGWFAGVQRLTGIPLLVKLHGPAFLSLVPHELATDFGRERIAHEERALRTARALAAPSRDTLEHTLRRLDLHPEETAVIPNPVLMDEDTPLWQLQDADRSTVLFVGRFDLRKGADLVLQAFRSALTVRPDLRLIFVGPERGIAAADGRLLRFDEYTRALLGDEAAGRVDFRGELANPQIAQLRARALVTVVASRWENQSYAVLEAMYQGCPLLCSDAGGNPEIVIDGMTGRLARSDDAADFAAKLLALLNDPEAARILGASARRFVLEHHSPQQVAAASLALYERVRARAGG